VPYNIAKVSFEKHQRHVGGYPTNAITKWFSKSFKSWTPWKS
jgi:hypothetical protein